MNKGHILAVKDQIAAILDETASQDQIGVLNV